MAGEQHLDDHGKSVAGWTGITVIVLGALVIGIGVFFGPPWVWMVGWAIVAIGAIVGFALSRAGFGHRRLTKPIDHDLWVAATKAERDQVDGTGRGARHIASETH